MVQQIARRFVGNWLKQNVIIGETVGGNTSTRFHATHVLLLPAAPFTQIWAHLTLVFKQGISEMPVVGKPIDSKTYRQEYQALERVSEVVPVQRRPLGCAAPRAHVHGRPDTAKPWISHVG